MSSSLTDEELLEKVKLHYDDERLLDAARLLRQIEDKSLLTEFHNKLLTNASVVEEAVADLLSEPDEHWIKQGETSGTYPTSIYYKLEDGARMHCRLETPLPSSLLVPLLSVLNESELYRTWIPSWTYPVQMGVRESKQLLNDTRGHQIIQVHCDVPWPMYPREALFDVIAVDDIENSGTIIAKMQSLTEESQDILLSDDFVVPPPDPSMDRMEFDGAVLFRPCPKDHPNFANASEKFTEDLVLLQFLVFFDAHMMVPQSVINFVTRTAIGMVWNMLLRVAEQVRDGTRIEHKEVIEQKAEFYKWMEDRCRCMLQKMRSKEKGDLKEEDDLEKEDYEGWTMKDVIRLST